MVLYFFPFSLNNILLLWQYTVVATVKCLLCQLHQNLSEALQKLLPNIFEVRSHYDLQLQNGSHKWMLSLSLPLSVSFFDGCQCLCVFIFMADLLYYCVCLQQKLFAKN